MTKTTDMPSLLVGWTTFNSADTARIFARRLISEKAAACVQMDQPILSFYEWKGKVEEDEEFRLWIKGTPAQFSKLGEFLKKHHPYDTPQWVVCGADFVEEKYLQWAQAND
ncbi:MAG: divalent-cation tolerance protein CutA [Opitutales bacterium]|nr:divalent-cation tolerance protein CutA [Opitutales bacterium]